MSIAATTGSPVNESEEDLMIDLFGGAMIAAAQSSGDLGCRDVKDKDINVTVNTDRINITTSED